MSKQIEIPIAKSLIVNILYSIILTFIIIIILFQNSGYYIDNNPLSQFGPMYRDDNYGAWYEVSNDMIYPDITDILLIQAKIILTGRFDLNLGYLIFGITLLAIYLFKYVRIKVQ